MHDKVKITLKSGKGGDGAIAFRHEKSIMNGGPYGGNGGRGGSIYLKATSGIDSLSEYRFGKTFRAEDGEDGKSKLQYGKDGKDIVLLVPRGTVVEELDGTLIHDLKEEGDTFLICKGGRGGRGNATFKSPIHRTPNIAENGLPGEEKTIYLELKLIADVGLVGFPNTGKSTYISAVTRASAQIAPYPFTTLSPQLGVCFLSPDERFVIADIPGLIEGASIGKGLGYTFLRHIERCRVLLHMIDLSNSLDLFADYMKIKNELVAYSSKLADKKMVIALNKADENYDRDRVTKFKSQVPEEVFVISSKEKTGLDELNRRLYQLVNEYSEDADMNEEEVVYRAKDMKNSRTPEFCIVKRDDGRFEIVSERVVRTKRLINLSTDEGMDKLLHYLDKIGVDQKLKDAGCQEGDTVLLDDFEFEYYE